MTAPQPVEITPAPQAGGCSCHEHVEALPELDARLIPHAVRHGAIIGAVNQLAPGAAVALIAPHDPLPLLAQLRSIFGDQLEISYLVEGPEAWKLKLAKRA